MVRGGGEPEGEEGWSEGRGEKERRVRMYENGGEKGRMKVTDELRWDGMG